MYTSTKCYACVTDVCACERHISISITLFYHCATFLEDTITKAMLIRTTFNWVWLTGSEIQSNLIKMGAWPHPSRHGPGGTS